MHLGPGANPGSLGTSILELQGLAGNTAVTRMLRETGVAHISRAVDSDAAPPSALDDPNFNAESIVHDLLRAIDQNEHTVVFDDQMKEDAAKERRNVDFARVVAALEDRTPSQIAEIEKRYRDFEHRDLAFDLFEGGESGRQSSLTADQRARIGVLLRGTRGEPIPTQVAADLKKYPPDLAARIGAALVNKSNAAAALQQFEADGIEVHELLWDALDEPHVERLMALYRRPVTEVAAVESFFAQHFGPGTLDTTLLFRLTPLQRSRLLALRHGDWAQADAYAIEQKRRAIDAISKDERDDAALDATPVGLMIREQREKKKAELSGDVEGILDNNRREALADPASAGKSSGQVVAERLKTILEQRVGESGATLGTDLSAALPREHAAIIAAATDSWNTSGSASLIESAAAELVAMEKDHTTSAEKIIATLRSFRSLAEHDLRARVLDPSVKPEEKQAIGNDIPSAVTRLAQSYIEQYRAAYDRQRGEGRAYDDIIKSASDADETYIGDLTVGGGRTSDLGELERAMDKRDIDAVKDILRRQPGQQAIRELIASYNRLGDGRDLRKELFGTTPDGSQLPAEAAANDDLRWISHGLLTGRNAAQIEEQLEKPETATTRDGSAQLPGQAEVSWLTTGGLHEFQATMANRGATGKLREIGGDPETEQLLKSSTSQLMLLSMQFAAAPPDQRQHLLLEIRKLRATLTGDADAYEKDNERVLGEIRGALSFAVSIALAVALPGAGAGLAAFIEATAVNVAANVAANMVIKGGDYNWADLKGDVLGGVLGAAGGKFGEELLGRVVAKIAPATGKAAADVGERVGIQTALANEVSSVATSGERVAVGTEEFEAREAGHETAETVTEAGQPSTPGLAEKGAREVGGFFGGIYGAKLYTGDFGLSVEELLKALATTGAGKAAHHKGGQAHESEEQHPTEETKTLEPDEIPAAVPMTVEPPTTNTNTSADTDAFGPRTAGDMLADNGLPPDSAAAFQAFADEHDVVIKVRPTNTASLPVLQEGGLPKAEIVKAKTLNRTDMLIGGPPGQQGKVGFFEPTMPPGDILDVLSPEARQQVIDRFNQRLEEYHHYRDEYAQLAAEGLVRIENGVLQIADPRQAATPDAPRGPFKDVGGDHDVYDIRHSDGSPLTDAQRALASNMLRSMGINVEHGYHTAWQQDSPGTYSPEADAKIRNQHTDREPLVAFVPKSPPREVFADTEVHGPERTPGVHDRHRPLKGATEVAPGPHGTGGPDELHDTNETDFSTVGESKTGTSRPTVREARPVHPRPARDAATIAEVQQVLPELEGSRKFIDRYTAALVTQKRLNVEILEELDRVDPKDWPDFGDDSITPRDYIVVEHPRLGMLPIRKGTTGNELGGGEVIISQRQSKPEIKRTLRHEINHALRPPSEPGSLQNYKDEFDAYWVDGTFSDRRANERPEAIREHILDKYPSLADSYQHDPTFQESVDAYTAPEGNTLNSLVWANVQELIYQNGATRDEQIYENLMAANSEERHLLRDNPNFQALLKDLPADVQAKIQSILRAP
ncbi:MAG: hypothetical protein JO057_30215 [Chloroflexi bacterium]|nr:hypothetical protein [Chloroflexota bacterium]